MGKQVMVVEKHHLLDVKSVRFGNSFQERIQRGIVIARKLEERGHSLVI